MISFEAPSLPFLSGLRAPKDAAVNNTSNQNSSQESQTILFDFVVENINYEKLVADGSLFGDFEEALKEAIASESGVDESAVEIKCTAGSVRVEVSISPGAASTLGDAEVLLSDVDAAVSDDSMRRAILDNIRALDGIDDVSTGSIIVGNPTTPVLAGGAEYVPASGDGSCPFPCVAGRGICVEGFCFCRHPFVGLRCERKMRTGLTRLSQSVVVALALTAAIVGMLISGLLYKGFFLMCVGGGKKGPTQVGPKKESWKPKQIPSRAESKM